MRRQGHTNRSNLPTGSTDGSGGSSRPSPEHSAARFPLGRAGTGHLLTRLCTMPAREGDMIHTAMNMADHRHCRALSSCFRGKLCEQLMNRPGHRVAQGALVYGLGDSAQSVFFLRQGFVKLTSLTEDGRELILRLHQAG